MAHRRAQPRRKLPPRSQRLPPVARSERGNQRHAPPDDGAEALGRSRRRRRERERELQHVLAAPSLAYVYLPPLAPHAGGYVRREGEWRSERAPRSRRAAAPLSFLQRKRHSRRDDSSEDSDEDCTSDFDDDYESDCSTEERGSPCTREPSIRNQRIRSLVAMSKLQHAAASTIQREFRFYRRRRVNGDRRNRRLAAQAQSFLHGFLAQELRRDLVPACLLEILREKRAVEAAAVTRKQELVVSLAEREVDALVDDCTRDVFHGVLQALVASYLAERLDLSRAATCPARAVAGDLLDEWTAELVAEILPEALVELTEEYEARLEGEDVWEEMLQEQLRAVAMDAVVATALEDIVVSIASSVKMNL